MSSTGLYYADLKFLPSPMASTFMQTKLNSLKFPPTVAERIQEFSKRDQEDARAAREFQITYNNISNKRLLKLDNSGQVTNLPVTRDHLLIADYIWGKNVHSIKGKTVTLTIKHVAPPPSLPRRIANHYRNITLCVNVMFVCGIKFLLTVSRHLDLVTMEYIADKKCDTYVKAIETICTTYARRNFFVTAIFADPEFKSLENYLDRTHRRIGYTNFNQSEQNSDARTEPELNVSGEDKHVKDAELKIRTIKEGARSMRSTISFFKRIPKILLIILIGAVVFWSNASPSRFNNLSPSRIDFNRIIDYKKHCRFKFGDYVQATEKVTNTVNKFRTVGAIAGHPTGNAQGTRLFYSLRSGRPISRNGGTKLPVADHVIDRIHDLADRESQPETFIITDAQGNKYDPEDKHFDEDPDYAEGDTFSIASSCPQSDTTGVSPTIYNSNDFNANLTNTAPGHLDDSDDKPAHTQCDDDSISNTGVDDLGTSQETAETTGVDNTRTQNNQTGVDEPMTERKGYFLRPRKKKSYTHLHGESYLNTRFNKHKLPPRQQHKRREEQTQRRSQFHKYYDDEFIHDAKNPYKNGDEEGMQNYFNGIASFNRPESAMTYFVNHVILAQYGMKKRLELFGDAGVKAIEKEMKQVNDQGVISPVHVSELTKQQKNRALLYLMFLKQKRDGSIKGRGCADGRKQQQQQQQRPYQH